MSTLLELSEDNLADIVNENERVVVQYGATWCGACKVMKPRVKKHAEETENVTFVYVDVEQFQESRSLTTIQNLPTFVGFVNGEVVAKEIGSKPDNLKNLVNTVIG
jgi:thiol-disulfide isomerase/thioredoxin